MATLLLGAVFMTQVVVPRMIQSVQKTNASGTQKEPTYPVCESIPVTVLQRHVKHASSVGPGSHGPETCRWVIRPTDESRTFSLSMTFGRAASLQVDVIGRGKPGVSANNGYAIARIPAGTRLPGWSKTATKADRPIALTLSYPAPSAGKVAAGQKANTAAMRSLTALAEEVARVVATVDDVKAQS
jgi:hypothetical protein